MEQEGVIKYRLEFQHRKLEVDPVALRSFNTCRTRLKHAGLIGQDPLRYDGFGFGNISFRAPEPAGQFFISGTQTGEITTLSADQLACVGDVDVRQNHLWAWGATEPSSEAMTHAVIYHLDRAFNAVVHVHSPDIWYHCDALNLASTSADIEYGTPELAEAVRLLCQSLQISGLPLVFVMKGHQDGVVAAGASLETCTDTLLSLMADASGKKVVNGQMVNGQAE